MTIKERFDQFDSEHLKFDRVAPKHATRLDVHAFIVLDRLFPTESGDIVTGSGHGEIWLGPNSDEINSLTDEQILELVRCGVRYDEDHESLAMFV